MTELPMNTTTADNRIGSQRLVIPTIATSLVLRCRRYLRVAAAGFAARPSGPADQTRHAFGLMFWFTRNRFFGSYFFLIERSRL